MIVDHIDVHVRSLERARRLFDALMPKLGLPRARGDLSYHTYYPQNGDQPFLCLMAGEQPVAGTLRVAFAGRSRANVDELAALLAAAGAHEIEGPQLWDEYDANYYAVFFEDGDGNKYEICYRHAE